jgi:hypothetical protein
MMNEPVRKESINESRATVLVGLTKDQLRELCKVSGLGHEEPGETPGHRVFTYEELYQLCRLVKHAAA